MEDILKSIFKLSISGSIFFMIISLIFFFTKRVFSAKWNYLILKLNMIFYIFPIVLIFEYFNKNSTKVYLNYFNIIFNEFESKSNSLVFLNCFFIVWVLGVSIFIIWNSYCYHKFSKEVMKFTYEDNEFNKILYKCKVKLNITSSITIRKSDNVNSPMVFGLIKPKVIIPSNIEHINNLESIITHELVHLKRKDLWTKFIQIGITAINWFNPIIYMMNGSIEKWCEISCDEIVAARMSYEERKEYGKTVLSIIEDVSLSSNNACLYLCNDKKYIKRRLIMMLKVKKQSKIKNIFASLLTVGIVLGATGVSITATTSNNVNTNNINLEGKTYEEAISILKSSGMDFMVEEHINNNSTRGSLVTIDTETGQVISSISFGNR